MGSVYSYETKAGRKLYRIVYRRPDHKQTQERGFTRRRDAELRLAEVELGKAKGDYVNPADAREGIASVATGWLSAREHLMKPSSYQALPVFVKVGEAGGCQAASRSSSAGG